MGNLNLTLTSVVKTQCRNCYACCVGIFVDLEPEDYDLWEEMGLLDGLLDQTELNPDETARGIHERILKQKDDGSCVFLCNGLCTIYDIRPRVCRDFEYLGKYCAEFRKRCGFEEET